jgi:rsbT co-antagonist protein RsbR
MTRELGQLGEMIFKKKYDIAKEVHVARLAEVQMTAAQQQEFHAIEAHIIDIRANFISLFGEALINQLNCEETIQQWGEQNGNYFVDLGVPLNEALKDTRFYREYIWKAIQEEIQVQGFSVDTVFQAIAILGPLLDQAVYHFSLTYIESFQRSLENAQTALLELSVPVVSIEPDVGILPLIGVIDTQRAKLLMEETLKQAEQLKLNYLVLEMSGVLTIDTMVADQIFKVINALSLIGVKTIVTGIRPDVAQTVVSLGISLDHLIIKNNPYNALNEIKALKNQAADRI